MSTSTAHLSATQRKRARREAANGGKNTGPSNDVPHIPVDVDKTPEALAELAYKLSLENDTFIDTKFFAHSRRKPDGTFCGLRAVYVNSWILRAKLSSYFEPLLRGGYKTTFNSLDSQFSNTFKSEIEEYDYNSDNDIDGHEEGDGNPPGCASVSEKPATEKAGDPSKDEHEADTDATKQVPTRNQFLSAKVSKGGHIEKPGRNRAAMLPQVSVAEVMSRLIAKLAQDAPAGGKLRPTRCNYRHQSDPNLMLKCGSCNNYFPST